jgi:hypothetical protein
MGKTNNKFRTKKRGERMITAFTAKEEYDFGFKRGVLSERKRTKKGINKVYNFDRKSCLKCFLKNLKGYLAEGEKK